MAATIGWGVFGGENRKKSSFLLSNSEAVLCLNIDLSTGKMVPFNAPGFLRKTSGTTKDIAFFAGNVREFDFLAETAIVGVPRGGRREELLVSAVGGDRAPQFMAAAGDTSLTLFRLGAPFYNSPPVVNITAGDNPTPDNEKRGYRFSASVIMDDGTESAPWGISAILSRGDGGFFGGFTFDVPVVSATDDTPIGDESGLEEEVRRGQAGAPSGGYPARGTYEIPHSVRLYSQVSAAALTKVHKDDVLWSAGNNIANPNIATAGHALFGIARVKRFTFDRLNYAAELDATTQAQFLGDETRPRLDMRGIVVHPKGFCAGFSGNFLCFSASEQYGVYPRRFEVEIPEGDIVALREFDSDLYVFVANQPPLRVRVDSPDNIDIRRSESTFLLADGAHRAIVNMGQFGLWYPSEQGMVALPSGQLITEAIIGERDFDVPTFAFADADEYFGARSLDMLYLNRRGVEPGFIQAGRIDYLDFGMVVGATRGGGSIYLLHAGGTITIWRAGEPMVMTWKSGKYKLPDMVDCGNLAWVYGGGATDGHSRVHSTFLPAQVRFDDVGDGGYPNLWEDAQDVGPVSPFFADTFIAQNDSDNRIQVKLHLDLPEFDADVLDIINPASEQTPRIEGSAIVITLPDNADARDRMTSGACDCAVQTPMCGYFSVVQLEVISEREIEFVGAFGRGIAEFLDLKARVAIYPAHGYVG